jgi:hypothetical protein
MTTEEGPDPVATDQAVTGADTAFPSLDARRIRKAFAPQTWPWMVLAMISLVLWAWHDAPSALREGVETSRSAGSDPEARLSFALGASTFSALVCGCVAFAFVWVLGVRKLSGAAQLGRFGLLLFTALFFAVAFDWEFAHDPSSGLAEKQAAIIRDYQARLDADDKGYSDEMDALQVNEVLDGDHLRVDPTLSRSRASLEKARAVVSRHAALSLSRPAETRARLAAIPYPAGRRRALLAEFDAREAKVNPVLADVWANQLAQNDEQKATIDDLARSRADWSVRMGAVTFHSQSGLKTFNGHVQRLNGLVDRLLDLRDKLADVQGVPRHPRPARAIRAQRLSPEEAKRLFGMTNR